MTTRKRGVIDIREVEGPKGGKLLVLTLSCGHWMTSRTAKKQSECIACWVDAGRSKREAKPLTTALEVLDDVCSHHFGCDPDCTAVKDAAWAVVTIFRDLKRTDDKGRTR